MNGTIPENRLPDYIYEVLWPRLASARGAETGTGPGYSWTASPHPIWGQALWDLDPETGIQGTGSEAAWTASVADKARTLRALVSTGPLSRGKGAEKRLIDAGFTRHRVTDGMVLPRSGFNVTRPARISGSESLTMSTVHENSGWLAWSRILCENLFQAEAPDAAEAFALALSRLAAQEIGFTAFLGLDDSGKPVATSATLLCPGGIGGIFYVAVDAAARRRGYGAAITAHACEAAFASGCGLAALTATPDGAPVYAKLGFRKVSDVARWKAPQAGR